MLCNLSLSAAIREQMTKVTDFPHRHWSSLRSGRRGHPHLQQPPLLLEYCYLLNNRFGRTMPDRFV